MKYDADVLGLKENQGLKIGDVYVWRRHDRNYSGSSKPDYEEPITWVGEIESTGSEYITHLLQYLSPHKVADKGLYFVELDLVKRDEYEKLTEEYSEPYTFLPSESEVISGLSIQVMGRCTELSSLLGGYRDMANFMTLKEAQEAEALVRTHVRKAYLARYQPKSLNRNSRHDILRHLQDLSLYVQMNDTDRALCIIKEMTEQLLIAEVDDK
jgi:hypothetical protein